MQPDFGHAWSERMPLRPVQTEWNAKKRSCKPPLGWNLHTGEDLTVCHKWDKDKLGGNKKASYSKKKMYEESLIRHTSV